MTKSFVTAQNVVKFTDQRLAICVYTFLAGSPRRPVIMASVCPAAGELRNTLEISLGRIVCYCEIGFSPWSKRAEL